MLLKINAKKLQRKRQIDECEMCVYHQKSVEQSAEYQWHVRHTGMNLWQMWVKT